MNQRLHARTQLRARWPRFACARPTDVPSAVEHVAMFVSLAQHGVRSASSPLQWDVSAPNDPPPCAGAYSKCP
jgi:hypothetical protein